MTAPDRISMRGSTKKRLWSVGLGSMAALVLCAMTPLVVLPVVSTPVLEVLVSIAMLSTAALLIVAAVVTWHGRGARATTVLGLFSVVVALVLSMASIWSPTPVVFNPNPGFYDRWSEPILGLSWVLAGAIPLSNLLSLAALPGRWRIVRLFTIVCIWGFSAAILTGMNASSLGFPYRSEGWFRVTMFLALAGSFGVAATCAVHYRCAVRDRVPSPVPATSVLITCPACAFQQSLNVGNSACARCRLRFHIEIEAPTCPGCGYLCFQLTSDRCPECGASIAAPELH